MAVDHGSPIDGLQELRAGVVRLAGQLGTEVLQEQGHATERPVRKVGGCLGDGGVEAGLDDGVERRVQRLDPFDGCGDELTGRRSAGAHQVGLSGRVEPGEIVVGHVVAP